jgi:hypothetical protein
MCGTPDKSRIAHPVAEQYRHQAFRKSSGSLAMFAAILRALIAGEQFGCGANRQRPNRC